MCFALCVKDFARDFATYQHHYKIKEHQNRLENRSDVLVFVGGKCVLHACVKDFARHFATYQNNYYYNNNNNNQNRLNVLVFLDSCGKVQVLQSSGRA